MPFALKNLNFYELDLRIIAVLTSIFYLVINLRKIKLCKSQKLFLIFIIYTLIVSLNNLLSGDEYYEKILLSSVGGLIVSIVLTNEKNDILIDKAFLVVAVLLFVTQIFQLINLLPDVIVRDKELLYEDGRYSGLGYVNDNGLYYLLVYIIISSSNKILSLLPLIMIGGNGASASIITTIIIKSAIVFKKNLKYIFPVLIVMAGIIYQLIPEERINSVGYRFLLWQNALNNYDFSVNNILFGIGVLQNRELTLPLQFGNVHSNILGLFFSYGIIGLIIYLITFYNTKNNILFFVLLIHGITHESYYVSIIAIAAIYLSKKIENNAEDLIKLRFIDRIRAINYRYK